MPNRKRLFIGLLAVIPYAIVVGGQTTTPRAKVDFAREIAPIFKAHCTSCHSSTQQSGSLRLDTAAGIAKGGVSGKLFTAGKGAQSLLIERIEGKGGKPRMPMGFAPLTKAQTDLIVRWINEGGVTSEAADPAKHWAYQKPVRPAVPPVKDPAWVKNPIDNFVLSRLQKGAISPSPEASKETLIRRVTLDLTGLPPTLSEIDAFLADKRPDAYERVVDRLLASPHYGERQARIWLDLARYADTNGYEADFIRTAYKYRDWVIDAFNKNIPYDQFTIEQIAGDLLPNATVDQLVATGFNRNTMFNSEGGVHPDEAMYETVIDRVGTTSTVWLGTTMACARCHDHKYDPFSQKDFYRMYAFFGNNEYTQGGDYNVGSKKYYEPTIQVPGPETKAKIAKLEEEIGKLESVLQTMTPELAEAYQKWASALSVSSGWQKPDNLQAASAGATLLDGDTVVATETAKQPITLRLSSSQKPITAIRIYAIPDDSLPKGGPGLSSGGNFILSKVEFVVNGQPVKIEKATVDFIQDGYSVDGLFDDNGDTGWAIYPQAGKQHELMLILSQPVPAGQTSELRLDHSSPSWPMHIIGRMKIRVIDATDPMVLNAPPNLFVRIANPTRSGREREEFLKAFRELTPLLKPTRDRLAAAKAELQTIKQNIPVAMVMRDKPSQGPLKAFVHHRGEFLSKEEEVTAGTPTILPPLPPNVRADRLALAKWLVNKSNPLTARVQVNRMWEQYFGHGLVETSEDFGTQSSPPTHPELLDWLATEFMANGWDMKKMHRLIVTSNTYRQSSSSTPYLLSRDPQNKLYARGPRFRMEAEMIRDTALTASGLISLEIGGPSVMPEQPAGIWDSPYSGERWQKAAGENQYRRGLYTFWKRTSPYPSFMAFDATSRESCTVRRIRTNTPLQALALLNDKAYLEAATALANRMDKADPEIKKKLNFGFRLCTGRHAQAAEMNRLIAAYNQLHDRYKKSPEEAKKLGGSPEMAALTMIGNILLNLDETITKG
ncbi:MAG: PSD1 domain-containing protein [Fimbriimonadaceae bacterium]|nr:PSD1 domain-containing protein [Fimbriimonadaceae bacterium]